MNTHTWGTGRRLREKSGNCNKCGVYREVLQRDHIVPRHIARRLGWTTEQVNAPENIQRLCANCHQDKTLKEIVEANRGRVVTAETRQKLAVASTGRKHSDATRATMRKPHRSHKRTPEHQAKLAEARIMAPRWSAAARAKASVVHTGLPWSRLRRQRFEQSKNASITPRLFE
jgi:HNH endonuclease